MNLELRAEAPSDVVVILGPQTRYVDRLPQAALEYSTAPHRSSSTSSSGLT